jgi:hypothetical protein
MKEERKILTVDIAIPPTSLLSSAYILNILEEYSFVQESKTNFCCDLKTFRGDTFMTWLWMRRIVGTQA